MNEPRPPDRTHRIRIRINAVYLVIIPLGFAGLILWRSPHVELRALAAFVGLVPLAWAVAASALTAAMARSIRLVPHTIGGDRHAFGRGFLAVDLVNASGRWPAVGLEVTPLLRLGSNTPFQMPAAVVNLEPLGVRTLSWKYEYRIRGAMSFRFVQVWACVPGSLLGLELQFDDGRSWTVGPARYKLRTEVLEALTGRRQTAGRPVLAPASGEEMCGLRSWRPGDSPRLIAWSRSMRRGRDGEELAVREYEDPGSEDVCLVLDTLVPQGSGREWTFEKAIAFTAALTRLLLERRYRVRVRATGAVDLLLNGGPRDDARLTDALSAISAVSDPRMVDDLVVAAVRESRGALLFVSLRDTATEEVDRRLPVVSMLPSWFDALVTEVVGA